jgi:hypothetical protein
MKNIIICSILITFVFSCKTPENSTAVIPVNASPSPTIKFTDKLVAEYGINVMRVDSNFNYNWDWTTRVWNVSILNYLGQTVQNDVTSPFWDASQKHSHVDITKVDMYPKDGWTLLKRDLGNKTSSPVYPYVILYNPTRGLLRVCIMRTRQYFQSFEETTISLKDNSYMSKDTTETPLFDWMVTQHDVSKLDKSKIKPSLIDLNVKEVKRIYSN